MKPHYDVDFGGEVYRLSLKRTKDDGLVPMWVRMALQKVMRGASIGYPFESVETVDEFFRIALENPEYVLRVSDSVVVPIPWSSYSELDTGDMEVIARDFFLFWLERMRTLQNYKGSTADFLRLMNMAASIFQSTLGWQ